VATPIKAITYLSGVYPQAPAPVLAPRPLPLAARTALVMRVAPALWKPLYYHTVQARGRTVLVPRPLVLQAMTALKMTLFWRGSNALPMRGQRYPLSR
jgi:hypothetical protein